MILSTWNCQGLGLESNDPTIPFLHTLIQRNSPSLLCLFETKAFVSVVSQKLRCLGFSDSWDLDAVGLSEGIWLAWTKELSLEVVLLVKISFCVFVVIVIISVGFWAD